MCAAGTDIGMQQQKPATQINACTTLGCRPAIRLPCVGAQRSGRASVAASGGGFSRKRHREEEGQHDDAIGQHHRLPAEVADAALEQRRPHTPATYWPEEISAIAAPRRRSNQRLT